MSDFLVPKIVEMVAIEFITKIFWFDVPLSWGSVKPMKSYTINMGKVIKCVQTWFV